MGVSMLCIAFKLDRTGDEDVASGVSFTQSQLHLHFVFMLFFCEGAITFRCSCDSVAMFGQTIKSHRCYNNFGHIANALQGFQIK